MRTLKIFSLIIIPSITITAQWYQQNSGTGYSLYAVSFVDTDHGWAVGQPGELGTILSTTDGGLTWIPQTHNSGAGVLLDVKFIDINNGWISGQYGKILRTTNGGQNWSSQSTGVPYAHLSGIQFVDLDNGWVVGDFGVVLHTTNGGILWSLQSAGTNLNLKGVFFVNLNTGWIVGDYGIIRKTTDGGQTWANQSFGSFHSDVLFVDDSNGWVVGEAILRTTNGGQTWITQLNQPNVLYIGISFVNGNTGWVVGMGGRIFKTTNGGSDWIQQTSGVNPQLYEVCFTDSLTGTAVGEFGTIVRTINGGIPVELISFTASVLEIEKTVELNWSTATETNNSGFEILRSTQNDNDEWEKIGFVPGNGTTTETQHYSFIDNDVNPGRYQYKLKQIDYDGRFEYSQIVEVEIPIVNEFSLSQNYPNPFNPSTKISWQSPVGSWQTLKVYDVIGNEIGTLVNEEKAAGTYEVEFSAKGGSASGGNIYNLPSGIYFYRLDVGNYSETKKMILLK